MTDLLASLSPGGIRHARDVIRSPDHHPAPEVIRAADYALRYDPDPAFLHMAGILRQPPERKVRRMDISAGVAVDQATVALQEFGRTVLSSDDRRLKVAARHSG